jgi:large subunit ribosomal protein L4
MKLLSHTIKTNASTQREMSELVFNTPWNKELMHTVITSLQSNLRQGSAHTKDRSEVSGGGRKPWKQKGTGQARHGSRRSPIWRHGGVSHGPRNVKDYSKDINQKERVKSLFMALSQKARDGRVLLVEDFPVIESPKTQIILSALKSLSVVNGFETLLHYKNDHNVLLLVESHDSNLWKSSRNIHVLGMQNAQDLNTLEVMRYRYIVIATPSLVEKTLEARHASIKKSKSE